MISFFPLAIVNSINHEYKEWNGEKTKVCAPGTNRFIGHGNGPQEVDTGKQVVFTYDISFEVASFLSLFSFFFP